MNRLAKTTTLAACALALVACKGPAADAIKLVPKEAEVVAGVDLKGIQDSDLYKDNKEEFEKSGEDVLAAAKDCNLGPDTWKNVVVGTSYENQRENVVVVFIADGVGKKENLECVRDKMKEAGEENPFTFADDGKVLELEDGAKGFVASDDIVAIAGPGWVDEVEALVDGKGESVSEGALEDALDRTNIKKHFWFAAKAPKEAADLEDKMGFEAKDASGWVDISDGVELWLALGTDDADKAQEGLETQWGTFKGLASTFGVPQDTVDSVEFDTKGDAVTATAKVSQDDLEALEKQFKDELPFKM